MVRLFRKMARPWAIVFVLLTFANTLFPTVSYALTSGPTAPEATSFEPVDTTDMVNLATGDFTYNIPLLEVPGPAGGYPLSLSYHAGIQPNEDASWVGLGWTLNPGAITRLTNGLPDDYDAVKTSNRVYWAGGSQTTNSYGVSVGIANVATVSAGLSFSQDTYRGSGVGGYLGLGFGIGGINSPLSANTIIGVSPYGGSYSSAGIGAGIGKTLDGINIGASFGLNFNSSGDINAGLSAGMGLASDRRGGKSISGSLLGASISTTGNGGTFTQGGFASVSHNSREGNISTSIDNFQIDIPVWYGVNIHLGRSHVRYWTDESVNLQNHGSLYNTLNIPDGENHVHDTYHMQSTESIATGNNPEKYLEGSYMDYDHYSVNAQGLGGSIRPYHYNVGISSQDVINTQTLAPEIMHDMDFSSNINPKPHYRFVNEFSNKVTNGSLPNESSIITGENNSPLDLQIPKVKGAKHIEYFENSLIKNKLALAASKGFIECNASGFTRKATQEVEWRYGSNQLVNAEGKIGAFTITNQSGVNYHFSLPAYTRNEFSYSGKRDENGNLNFNYVEKRGRYAYTWYLTGITGPDYVDRGPNGTGDGKLNEYDWGYWVDFQYGQWTGIYEWRNPSEGFNQDIDNNFQTFSKGTKEIYYLNAIKTKTHTAFFVKEMRADGKSVMHNYWNPVSNDNKNIDEGTYRPYYSNGGKYYNVPRASLALKSIVVLSNDKLVNTIDYNNLSSNYNHCMNCPVYSTEEHKGFNILDVHDVANSSFPINSCIRKIDFAYDYSLAKGTTNSFDPEGSIYRASPNVSAADVKLGKLTLNSVTFKGKGGIDYLPPIKFGYDLYKKNLQGFVSSINNAVKTVTISFNPNSETFEEGDIVTFNQNGVAYHGYVANLSPGYLFLKNISSPPRVGQIDGLDKTKNPPYNKDLYDIWGMYKSD